jgi:hypothetical protein
MADVVVSSTAVGRITPTPVPMVIPITLTAVATTYATATGGLPFDLFTFLSSTVAPFAGAINPKDIIGFFGVSTLGWVCGSFAVGTTTSSTTPCTVRLWNGTTEAADGATTATISGFLMVQRGGVN